MASNIEMLIDVVDNENIPFGSIRRRQVLPQKQNFRTVHVFLFLNDKLLLQRLSPEHPRSPSKIGSSVAGYLFAGESYKEAASRRTYEELKIKPKLTFSHKLEMNDENSKKFIEVFVGKVDFIPEPQVADVSEIIAIELPKVFNQVDTNPNMFTKTFLKVIHSYSQK